jgi:two-component system, LuxR family, response regulator FixJ
MTKARRNMIAIVDDDDGARQALQFLLDVLGRPAESFPTATAFLDAAPQDFDCLILDQNMPVMTGLELVRRLRESDITIPTMLISGDLSPEVIEGARKAGVDRVSEKPLAVQDLAAFIDGDLH